MHGICGIDFGTTNSTIGVLKDGNPIMVPIEGNHHSIPSTLFFKKDKDLLYFGREAIEQYIQGNDGRFISSIKRILGSDLMERKTSINEKQKSFDELIFLFLQHIKDRAESFLNISLTSAIIGRPVHFQNTNKLSDSVAENKLHQIAEKIGFKEIQFQYEPIAAAFSHERELQKEKLALIVDLGGGTSDFSVIRLGPRYLQKKDRTDDILSTSGIRIGGNDFDRSFSLNCFMKEFGKGTTYGPKNFPCPNYFFSELSEWSKINFMYTPQNLQFLENIKKESSDEKKISNLINLIEFQEAHRLLKTVEDCKIKLASMDHISLFFDGTMKKIPFSISNTDFEEAIRENLNKIICTMNECLLSAQLKNEDIELVILTGGSCSIPMIQKEIRKIFINADISDKDKLLSVGLGLTYAAQRLYSTT